MTDLLERAVATMKMLPPEQQDEIARLVIALAGDDAGLVEQRNDLSFLARVAIKSVKEIRKKVTGDNDALADSAAYIHTTI